MLRPFQPHQAAGYEYLAESIRQNGYGIAGYDMGLGKTQIFLALIADAIRPVGTGLGGYVFLIGPSRQGRLHGRHQGGVRTCASPTCTVASPSATRSPACPSCPSLTSISSPMTPSRQGLARGPEVPRRCRCSTRSPPTLACSCVTRSAGQGQRRQAHRPRQDQPRPRQRHAGQRWHRRRRHRDADHQPPDRRPAAAPDRRWRATGAQRHGRRPQDQRLPVALLRPQAGGRRTQRDQARLHRHDHRPHGGPARGAAPLGLRPHRAPRVHGLPNGGWLVVPLALNGAMDRYDALSREFLATVLAEKGPEAMWRASALRRSCR